MTDPTPQLAEYTVTVVLAHGDERRVITVQLPAGGEDLAVAAGHELADSIAKATGAVWRLSDFDRAVTAASAPPIGVGAAVHLPPRFSTMARLVGEVLRVDPDGTAEVEVADRFGSYGCFYVPAVELRLCTHISQAEIDGFLDRLGEWIDGAGNGAPGLPGRGQP